MNETVVYAARKIITMDPNRPEASHVAVRDGRVLAVGGRDCADAWGEVRHDDRYAGAVLLPGFVEGHAHLMAGAMWRFAYVGYHDRTDPDGGFWKGMRDVEAVTAGLKAAHERLPEGEPLVAWGFDPIFLPTERLHRKHIDAV
ncbi:MAG TPA: amidohydrolase, partial [Paracoccaceae bacterium]|nr:amidohydrolase [Paracoccaceae bacterium]